MRILILLFILLIHHNFYAQNSVENKSYFKSIQKYRDSINKHFKNKKTTILSKNHLKKFDSLNYYKTNLKYKVEATIKRVNDSEIFAIPTTTGRKTYYKTYAIATFELEGKPYTLHIYQNQQIISNPIYKDYLFLPFKDLTNEETTYSGGRYVNMKIPKSNKVIIDFNKAYNPYCTYNANYSCPIPPNENHLNVAIKAGVKSFKK